MRASAGCAVRVHAHTHTRKLPPAYASATLRQLPATRLAFQDPALVVYETFRQQSVKKT